MTERVHAADNHLFFPGTGASTPPDYDEPQHVDLAIVADIASWLTAGHKGMAHHIIAQRAVPG